MSLDEARLRSAVWVQAQLRLCDGAAIPFVIERRGDPDAGAILLKVRRGADRWIVLSRGYDKAGRRIWARATGEAPVSEAEADTYLARQAKIDPDIWILAIEDIGTRYQPDGQVI